MLPLETIASSVKMMMVTFLKVFNDNGEVDVLVETFTLMMMKNMVK